MGILCDDIAGKKAGFNVGAGKNTIPQVSAVAAVTVRREAFGGFGSAFGKGLHGIGQMVFKLLPVQDKAVHDFLASRWTHRCRE